MTKVDGTEPEFVKLDRNPARQDEKRLLDSDPGTALAPTTTPQALQMYVLQTDCWSTAALDARPRRPARKPVACLDSCFSCLSHLSSLGFPSPPPS